MLSLPHDRLSHEDSLLVLVSLIFRFLKKKKKRLKNCFQLLITETIVQPKSTFVELANTKRIGVVSNIWKSKA